MAILRDGDIDFSELDGLLVEKIIREELGGEAGRAVIERLISRGATTAQVVGRVRQLLPSWQGTAKQVEVVTNYLMRENGRTAVGSASQ